MRTHFLNELDIGGRRALLEKEPSFDFYRIDRVSELLVDFGLEAGDLVTLKLICDYVSPPRRYRLVLQLSGVRDLKLPVMSPSFFVPELEIEDVSARGLEGIHYEVISHLHRDFECHCADILIEEFQLISPLG